jgi:hypothetical protein
LEAYARFCVETVEMLALMCKATPLDLQQVVADLIYRQKIYGTGEPGISAPPGSSNIVLQINLLKRARELRNAVAEIECDVEHIKEIGDELGSHAEYFRDEAEAGKTRHFAEDMKQATSNNIFRSKIYKENQVVLGTRDATVQVKIN